MAETRVLNPTVDLGKYRGNIVYSQTGNGKKKRCWSARFATTINDSHLVQAQPISLSGWGAAMIPKQACWDFGWCSEVMMSPSRFVPRLV